jgi:hypothetical protein
MTAAVINLTAFAHATVTNGAKPKRPAASEFGLGPRTSADGRYVATLAPERPLRPRQMQTVRVTVVDADGQPVEGAALTITGGMPQHGHGLPTRPRVTRSLGGGAYEIEGVRFNMGGWWEFKVTIATEAGADVVTFNLQL